MNVVLSSLSLPIRLRLDAPISDDDFVRFSRENRPLRMEREANGEILIMTPTSGIRTGNKNLRIGRLLDEWAERDGRGTDRMRLQYWIQTGKWRGSVAGCFMDSE